MRSIHGYFFATFSPADKSRQHLNSADPLHRGVQRVLLPVHLQVSVAYRADRKPFPFRSGIWLPNDYGATA